MAQISKKKEFRELFEEHYQDAYHRTQEWRPQIDKRTEMVGKEVDFEQI